MRIVFFGTSIFAVPTLEALGSTGHTPLAVVTRADQKGGRGAVLIQSPVKELALRKKIPILQPDNLSDFSFLVSLKEIDPELFIVVSYGKILSVPLLALPVKGSVNLHPSLLPKYRGASPIPWAILNGDTRTGLSVIRMTEEVDAGEILLQKEVAIGKDEDAVHLSERLAAEGGKIVIEFLERFKKGPLAGTPQKGKVTLAPRFKKEDGRIDWSKEAGQISRQIRALVPWPGSYSFLKGKRIVFWKAREEEGKGRPGEIIEASEKGGIRVAAGKGHLLMEEVQLEGKERMSAAQFLRGSPLRAGDTFSAQSVS